VTLKYVLLDASTKAGELLDRVHSMILASGTLSPVELLTQQLCRPRDLTRVRRFSCGHMVSAERVTAIGLGCGPTGRRITLTHGARDSEATLDECGLLVNNLCRLVPQGMVVFVPSFAYLDTVRQRHDSYTPGRSLAGGNMKHDGTRLILDGAHECGCHCGCYRVLEPGLCCRWQSTGLHAQLLSKKRIFWEVRDASECDAMLKQYQNHLQGDSAAGAMIVCVVGAKLSEGINFGDGLGRCVVVLGLPYPDMRDPELQERLAHADRRAAATSASARVPGRSGGADVGAIGAAGRKLYTNLCMQAVNQCVGRAIRHVHDYAAIVCVDARYCSGSDRDSDGIVAKLPVWVTRRWTDCPSSFGRALQTLAQFYAAVR
jgi:chromosome transmission fidelity protein 1